MPRPQTNTITHENLMAYAGECGTDASKGNDSQVKFARFLVEGAYHGACDRVKHKHGKGVYDATLYAQEYMLRKGMGFNPKTNSGKKLVSEFNTLIDLGQYTKGGQGEPISTLNDLMDTYAKLKGKVEREDAYKVVVRFARVQTKRDTMIEADELETLCLKPAASVASDADKLANIAKQLMKIGDSDNITLAVSSIRDEITAIASAKSKS